MILPNKNITLENSLLGKGSFILKELAMPQTISSLWERVKAHSAINSFEKFVITLDLLYLLQLVQLSEGIIQKTEYDKSNS